MWRRKNMDITIKREKINDTKSKFRVDKSKDMSWLEVLGVLEIAKKEVLDSLTDEKSD